MIPIDIGLETGAGFGSSDDMAKIKTISMGNYRAYKNFHSKNPSVYQNDSLFVRLITIVRDYMKRELDVEQLIPNLCQQLNLVYRATFQELHATEIGKLLVIPVFDDTTELFSLIYTDATELNYNKDNVIDNLVVVSINIKMLCDLIKYYDGRDIGNNTLITKEVMIPLMGLITNYAIFNTITGIANIKASNAPKHPFRIQDLGKFVYARRKRLKAVVTNLDTTPRDVLKALPTYRPIDYTPIDDSYINNLIWINLLSYHSILESTANLNRDKFYTKYRRAYSLYEPRGRGDKYFGSASSELLDKLEEVGFI